ncbi:MAG: ribokinase [Oscillospiraceae bacterium]|nr:ribokinase [Oscillospiraceae bacterium]
MSRKIVVAGLYGMSLLLHMKNFPAPGETVNGEMTALEAGGKGFNQAVSAARNGADVTFLTAVGEDAFGEKLAQECRSYGLSCMGSAVLAGEKTAAAAVMSDAQGESRVVVSAGACAAVKPEDFDFSRFPQSGILLLQNELPCGVNIEAAKAMKKRGGTVLLNPAPARKLEEELLRHIDFLIPNWGEALALAGLDGDAAPAEAAERLHELGAPNIIITLGGKGLYLSFQRQTPAFIEAAQVKAVDTSGAGDTFCGAFAARLAKGDSRRSAARFANFASGLSVTRRGIMQAIPFEGEIQAFMLAQTFGDVRG